MANTIFKTYDLRGKFPEELNETVIRQLAHAYIKVFNPKELVIGHDPLTGSTNLYTPLCEELSRLGVTVHEVGCVSSPMLYFAAAYYKIPQGIMLTASHLGRGHTGMKIVINGIPPKPEQLVEMRELFEKGEQVTNIGSFGKMKELPDFLATYKAAILKVLAPTKEISQYKIALDSSNGPNGTIIESLLAKLGVNYTIINASIEGENLAHDTNPKVEKNRQQLVEAVKNSHADLGIIWDGDGDRAYFVDQNGTIIPPEFIGIQISNYLIQKGLGSKMTVDVRGSSAVETEVSNAGGTVVRIEAWHVPIKFNMEKDPQIVFGMETSGHYVFRDFYKIDDGLLTSLMFLQAVSCNKTPLSTLLSDFRSKYIIIEEINFRTNNSETKLIKELKNKYSDAKISELDGITIDYPTWRFNMRASKTEPIIRLNISGSDKTLIDKNLAELRMAIGGIEL